MTAPRVRESDPLTSHEAAAATEDRVAASQAAVLTVLTDALMPLTDDEIAGYLKGQFSPSRVRTARHELEEDGRVVCAGTVKPPGRRTKCRTWVLAPATTFDHFHMLSAEELAAAMPSCQEFSMAGRRDLDMRTPITPEQGEAIARALTEAGQA